MFVHYAAICLTTASLVILYGRYICSRQLKDPLLRKLGVLDLDGWSLTHVLLYMYLGYTFPTHFATIMTGGVIWELLESSQGNNSWWFGRLSDILVNAIGFLLGCHAMKKNLRR